MTVEMSGRTALSEMRLLVIGAFVLSLLSYGTNILLANSMGPGAFGQYSYILLVGGLLGQLIFFGTEEMGIRLKNSHGPEALEWILTVRLLNFGLLTLSTALIWLGGEGKQPVLAMIIALNSLSMATHYESQGRNLSYMYIFLFERLAITIALLFCVFFFISDYLNWILLSLAIAQGFSLTYQYLDLGITRLSTNYKKLAFVYRQGFFLLIFQLSKFSFGGVTRILIFDQQGDRQLGIFATVWQFVPLATLYFAQATKAWRLRITEAIDASSSHELWTHIRALSSIVILPTALCSIVLAILGDDIIELLFIDDFGFAAELMVYLAAYLIVVGLDTIVVILAISLSMLRVLGLIYAVFGGAVLIASLFFGASYGLKGYFIMIILGHLSATIAMGVVVIRALKLRGHTL